jgi:hypothetical protein
VQGGLYIVSWLRNSPSKTVYVATNIDKITPAITTLIIYLIVYNIICIAVNQLVVLPASNQSHIILSKTIIKDKRVKELHYISDTSNKDYCYYNAGKASESEVNKQGLDESDTDIEIEGLPL